MRGAGDPLVSTQPSPKGQRPGQSTGVLTSFCRFLLALLIRVDGIVLRGTVGSQEDDPCPDAEDPARSRQVSRPATVAGCEVPAAPLIGGDVERIVIAR